MFPSDGIALCLSYKIPDTVPKTKPILAAAISPNPPVSRPTAALLDNVGLAEYDVLVELPVATAARAADTEILPTRDVAAGV